MLEVKLFLFLLQLSTLAFSDDDSNCMDNYLDFEEETFGNNRENRMKLHQAFYPPNDHLPYSVVVTYQAVLPNGTKVNVSTVPSCPDRQVWLWASSPALFLLSPTELNRLALYTLNHFTEWVPSYHTITIPQPCSAKAEEFLTLMTTSVSNTYNEYTECSLVHTVKVPCVQCVLRFLLFIIYPASGICFG